MTDGVNLQKHQINVLEVKNLKKIYGPRTVVKDVSLSIKSGEVVGLLGPNGAGKTTTFYMIVGLVAANGGQILLNGESISTFPSTSAPASVLPTFLRKTAFLGR